jgi:hypothetical protein
MKPDSEIVSAEIGRISVSGRRRRKKISNGGEGGGGGGGKVVELCLDLSG